jgi:hypothetical protein
VFSLTLQLDCGKGGEATVTRAIQPI